jgi:hypothetical protein
VSFNTATNRISTSGYAYDAAGNMTNDGSYIVYSVRSARDFAIS